MARGIFAFWQRQKPSTLEQFYPIFSGILNPKPNILLIQPGNLLVLSAFLPEARKQIMIPGVDPTLAELGVREGAPESLHLSDFWGMPPPRRYELLLQGICSSHTWHFKRNPAYRHTVASRGIGDEVGLPDLPRLLRPTSQTFKSYIEYLGTPFPDKNPIGFLDWFVNQLSIDLSRERFDRFRKQYISLEAFLQDIERIYSDFNLEILTSSGTSGRSTILARDQEAIQKTVESFYLSFQRYFGMQIDHRVVFIMPQRTRIAMARMAGFSLRRMGIPVKRAHFTIPFPAFPDQVRVRAGRTYRSGWRGWLERQVEHPFMVWMNDRLVSPNAVRKALDLLTQAEDRQEKILLFGSWIHIHLVALMLKSRSQTLQLASGSILGTGGGFKELYPFPLDQIRSDISQTIFASDGSPVPLRDVYGMAEANWAAMQCSHGSYHIPPWVFAVTLDENDCMQTFQEAEGLLAFLDPYGGGNLFPAFFKTSDRVRLINGSLGYDPSLNCPCGEVGAYLARDSIQRVDLLDEAGCAAQL